MDIDILIAAALAVITALGTSYYVNRKIAPLLKVLQCLFALIQRCRGAKADGKITSAEEQQIGQATVRFIDELDEAAKELLKA